MLKFERSIDIALSTKEPEEVFRAEVFVPISSTESKIALKGLNSYIRSLYGGVLDRSNPDRALFAVFEFLSEDADTHRRVSLLFQENLNPDKPETDESRIEAAMALTYLLRGQKAHKENNWQRGIAGKRQLNKALIDVLGYDESDFIDSMEWGYRQTARNLRFWRRQLESLRSTDLIGELRQAIEESDHY